MRRAAEELAHRDFFQGDSGWTLPAIWSLFGFEAWPEPNDKGEREQWKQWIGGFSMSAEDIETYLDGVLDPASESSRKLKAGILIADDPLRALMQQRNLHVRSALEFWDVIPQIAGDKLAVEIMTPHHSHYYQGKPEAAASHRTTRVSQPHQLPDGFLRARGLPFMCAATAVSCHGTRRPWPGMIVGGIGWNQPSCTPSNGSALARRRRSATER